MFDVKIEMVEYSIREMLEDIKADNKNVKIEPDKEKKLVRTIAEFIRGFGRGEFDSSRYESKTEYGISPLRQHVIEFMEKQIYCDLIPMCDWYMVEDRVTGLVCEYTGLVDNTYSS